MEAVPRLHMLWFALKSSPEGTSFAALKKVSATKNLQLDCDCKTDAGRKAATVNELYKLSSMREGRGTALVHINIEQLLVNSLLCEPPTGAWERR